LQHQEQKRHTLKRRKAVSLQDLRESSPKMAKQDHPRAHDELGETLVSPVTFRTLKAGPAPKWSGVIAHRSPVRQHHQRSSAASGSRDDSLWEGPELEHKL